MEETFKYRTPMNDHGYDNEFWIALAKLVADSELIIDRPRGSRHPKYPDAVYPVDYGYLKNTKSMDGDGIDIWKGSGGLGSVDAVICTVDLVKRDSEIKILIDCSDEEKEIICQFLNESDLMKGMLICRK